MVISKGKVKLKIAVIFQALLLLAPILLQMLLQLAAFPQGMLSWKFFPHEIFSLHRGKHSTTPTGTTTTGSTTGIPTTVFGVTGTTLGPTGTIGINDPGSVVGLFTNNLFCTFVAMITLWISGSCWL
ncbi:hypothetical protein F3Y22_tig00111721pilonHSYRG00211 [Hibiscus syriacus]|uniref:Uncharacterized protein n=1 Tax=Hibiscus syriacus TaxID=106335 RepID=A0A6A2XFN7_HIBSY|nr:hypothetical protein F3Y22_tig00111721pilonHSYRG00211 [Hibiscus syriacus]